MQVAGFVAVGLGIAAELDFAGGVGGGDFPGVAELQPLVGVLDLPAVAEFLAEDAELVAQAVADGGHAEGGHGIHVAGGETAEAAVAETGLGLLVGERLEVDADGGERFAALLGEAEVEQVVHEVRAEEKLRREITDDADVALAVGLDGADPVVHDFVANDVREGVVALDVGGQIEQTADGVGEVAEKGISQRIDRGFGDFAMGDALLGYGHGDPCVFPKESLD